MKKKGEFKGGEGVGRQYAAFFNKLWGNSKPLAKLFKTANREYLYDSGTNKVLGCDPLVYELIENFFSMDVDLSIQAFIKKHGDDNFLFAADSLKNTIETHNILKFKMAEDFYLTSDKCGVEEMVDAYMELLVLETTENCNLRCGYCVYDSNNKDNRNHGPKDMNLEVAKKALQYFKDHSYKQDKVGITSYGGEPLICFPFVKECVAYTRQLFKEKKIDFSITTNGTLITPKIAQFLKENDFLILVSIDGPEPIHNRFRKYVGGKGSYNDSMRGLKYLVDAYGDSAEKRLTLSMVYTPPFSSQKLDDISRLWDENDWLPKKLGTRIVYPNEGTIPHEFFKDAPRREDKTMIEWAYEKFRTKYNGKGQSNPIADSIVETSLANLMQRAIYNTPDKRINLNGCCVPGAKRLFVTTAGKFLICERGPSSTPPLGDVYSGIDMEVIKEKYIQRYMDISFSGCAGCWAARLCDSCYVEALKSRDMCPDKKFKHCESFKQAKEKNLAYCCTLLEDNPQGLDYLLERKMR